MEFKNYKRKGLSEMTPYIEGFDMTLVSVSEADKLNGSPKLGDMIARNPKNHDDKWLVAEKYFNDNLELSEQVEESTFDSRLINEYQELHNKVQKLLSFLQKENFEKIVGKNQANLLLIQYSIMNSYLLTLDMRIKDLDLNNK
jgi:uncharacterized protein YozE (UPF0346 family)